MNNKSKSIDSSLVYKSHSTSCIEFQFCNNWIDSYICNSKFKQLLNKQFPYTQMKIIRNIMRLENTHEIDKVRQFVQKQLSHIQKGQSKDQGLTQKQYEDYFLKDQQVNQIIKNVSSYGFLQGNVVMFYQNIVKKETIRKRQNQLSAYRKETLLLQLKQQQAPFSAYQNNKIKLLLQLLAQLYFQEFQAMATICKLHLLSVKSSQRYLKFNIIGFKKYFIQFYDKIIEFLFSLKTNITAFKANQKQQQFKILIEQHNLLKKQNINSIHYKYKDGFIVVLGDNNFAEQVSLYINSVDYYFQSIPCYSAKIKQFMQQKKLQLEIQIKKRVSYMTIDFQKMKIRTDSKNYKQCVNVIEIFIRQHMQLSELFYFDYIHQKETFLKYFKEEFYSIQSAQNCAIKYIYTNNNKQFIIEKLSKFYSKIKQNILKILIPIDANVTSKAVLINKKIHNVPIGYHSNAFSVKNFDIQITNRIQQQNTDCIICCYYSNQGKFYDKFIEPLLDNNTKACLQKINKKKQVSIHRISQKFCKNLVFHKFNQLSIDKVFTQLNTIFDQIKNDIENITLIIPYRYKYWKQYSEDFIDNLTYQLKDFLKLRRFVIVCQNQIRNEVIDIIQNIPDFQMKLTPIKQINQYYLLQHQCLNYYEIDFVDKLFLQKYSLNPLLILNIFHHKINQSQNYVLNIPFRNSNSKQYLINIATYKFFDTISFKQINKQFIKKIKCINSFMKKNKNNGHRKYDYILVYVQKEEIAGDYFKLDSIKNTVTLLNRQFQMTQTVYEFNIQQTKTEMVKSQIMEGYYSEIQSVVAQLKFSS